MIVADTCVVIWLAFEPEKLSPAATDAVERARSEGALAISGVTLYEVAALEARGRLRLLDPIEWTLAQIEAIFIVLPMTANTAHVAASLPEAFPRDPMDRMIVATALVRSAPLITSDSAILNSQAVEVIW